MHLGKPSSATMASTIWRLTGAKSRAVIVGPKPGVDVAVLDIGGGRVLVANCDPVSLIPSLGPEDSAAMSLYEVASDVATSGRPPRFVMLDLNLPPDLSDQVLSRYWKSINKTCLQLGVSILGGQPRRVEACDHSLIGRGAMRTPCRRNQFPTCSMPRNENHAAFTR